VPDITLYQFAASHYNEKARWALDLKRVPHRRVSLLPGPHAPRMKRLTGKTQTPALVDGEHVVAGSAAILAHLESRFPEPALAPAESRARDCAWQIAGEFDDDVGPAVRLAKFFELMSGSYATQVFGAGKPYLARAVYRASFPLVERVMKRSMGINGENAALGRERTRRAFDFVAEKSAVTGYLVGDRFSVADLTCAALLMPAVDVADLGGPANVGTAAERAWLERWSEHPGTAWVREIYRRHRRG
jgi:glutathione S-transferase